jgi:hypothetical protein
MKHSPKEILDIVKDIYTIEVDADGLVDIYWKSNPREPFTASEFLSGSFTRELIELFEKHLAPNEKDTGSSDPGLGQE